MKRIGRIPELTTKAKVLLGLTVFVFLAALTTFAVSLFLTQQMQSGGEKYNFKDLDASTRKKDAIKAAQAATNSGDTSTAGSVYEQAIKDEPDPKKKVELAISHSRMLKIAGKMDEAISVAKKAEAYNEDKYLITDWLAQLHESAKRYDEAAAYYASAGTMADSPTNIGKYSKGFYSRAETRMKELAKKD